MESDIGNWITDRLSNNLKEFNNLPACPFAKQAWVEGKVVTQHLQSGKFDISMKDYFRAELENFTYHWPKKKEVIVLGTEPENISSEELSEVTKKCNETFLAERGYLALEDHPSNIEMVDNYILNQGTWALILLQPLEKINTARRILLKKDYYKNWDPEYYNDVING